jgi:ABC-type histidine transport system ATPase subunit
VSGRPITASRCIGHISLVPSTAECSRASFAREVSIRVVFLHKGVVEEDGAPQDVFGAPKSERFKQFISSHR